MKKNIIDMIFDENCFDNIFVPKANGDEAEFEQVAIIPYNEMLFIILAEVSTKSLCVYMYDMDEAEEVLVLVEDEEIIEKVFEEYDKLCA